MNNNYKITNKHAQRLAKKKKKKKKKNFYKDRTSDRRFSFLIYGQRTYSWRYDPIHLQGTQRNKPLSKNNLRNLTESVNRKVSNDIIYTRNNLLHLDPGLFHY